MSAAHPLVHGVVPLGARRSARDVGRTRPGVSCPITCPAKAQSAEHGSLRKVYRPEAAEDLLHAVFGRCIY
ncbi:hypothetical protein NDU88_009096 [Pleurodeles waltl]|uniref:Uncharacterized protein n=1 Tax=Pleurodeles waltl TaxID=8319 RepID=A0AAV7P281_PLEWA|nr:hypothetical protein NDU88_009096 [Pleurodeles waltl]